MTPDQLSDAFVGALRDLVDAGALALPEGLPDRVVVQRPRSREHGDYASNVALQLAGHAGLPPRELAALLAARLERAGGIEVVEVAGPGFLNVRLAADASAEVAARVVAAGASYGSGNLLAGTVADPADPIGVDDARYAHSRMSSILRHADALGVVPAHDPAMLADEPERDLLLALADFPRVVAAAATLREPRRVARYLEDTASAFFRFYAACRVLPAGDEEPAPIHSARLQLVQATRVVLANGLDLLGVSAPERM